MRYFLTLISTLFIIGCSKAYVPPTYKKYESKLNEINPVTNEAVIKRNSQEYREVSKAKKIHENEYNASSNEYKKDEKVLDKAEKSAKDISNALEQYK